MNPATQTAPKFDVTTIAGLNAMLDATQPAREAARLVLAAGDRVRIEKGCAAREVAKNCSARVEAIVPMGAEYGHTVKVLIYMLNGRKSGKTLAFYVRHVNRLSDAFIGMHDGNPSHRIEIRRVAK